VALTYIYLTQPFASATAYQPATNSPVSGRVYTANAAGIITAVTPTDATFLVGSSGLTLTPIAATGLTADRPTSALPPGTSGFGTASLNDNQPALTFGFPYWDTTLSAMCFFVGPRVSTGWVNQAGTAV